MTIDYSQLISHVEIAIIGPSSTAPAQNILALNPTGIVPTLLSNSGGYITSSCSFKYLIQNINFDLFSRICDIYDKYTDQKRESSSSKNAHNMYWYI